MAFRRFLREAAALARLHHPSLPAVMEVGRANGVPYLIMELAAGQTLADRLELSSMGEGAVAQLALQLAGALEAIHAAGLLHRDVKPRNIVLRRRNRRGPAGRLRLGGSGVGARNVGRHSRVRGARGTRRRSSTSATRERTSIRWVRSCSRRSGPHARAAQGLRGPPRGHRASPRTNRDRCPWPIFWRRLVEASPPTDTRAPPASARTSRPSSARNPFRVPSQSGKGCSAARRRWIDSVERGQRPNEGGVPWCFGALPEPAKLGWLERSCGLDRARACGCLRPAVTPAIPVRSRPYGSSSKRT